MNDDGDAPPAPRRRSMEEIKAEARAYALSIPGVKKKKQQPTVPEPLRYRPWTAVADTAGPGSSLLASVTAAATSHNHRAGPKYQSHPDKETMPYRMESPSTTTAATSASLVEPFVLSDLSAMDDYERFVRSLVLDLNLEEDNCKKLLDDDEEDEFQLDSLEEEDEDDEEEEEDDADDSAEVGMSGARLETTPDRCATLDTTNSCTPFPLPLDFAETSLHSLETADFYREIAEELCWLEEEDMEAAVATLLNHPLTTSNVDENVTSPSSHIPMQCSNGSGWDEQPPLGGTVVIEVKEEPVTTTTTTPTPMDTIVDTFDHLIARTPLPSVIDSGLALETTSATFDTAHVVRSSNTVSQPQHRTVVTPEQYQQLKNLMEQHYQLLLQQAVLAVRAANNSRYRRYTSHSMTDEEKSLDVQSGGDSSEALIEAVDGAVGMLQDLDQNRKDAIRHQVQFETNSSSASAASAAARRANVEAGGTLTSSHQRSLFSEHSGGGGGDSERPFGTLSRRLTRAQFSKTLLNPAGARVKTVFDIRGLSKLKSLFTILDGSVEGHHMDEQAYLNDLSITDACEKLLCHGGSVVDSNLIPGKGDISTCFVDEREIFGDQFKPPCSLDQEIFLKKSRSLFTAGEDNLVLRGVNLYGEKQWNLICDRYLPERTINMISQRYGKLCLMLYKANGIKIDEKGNLADPPKLVSVDDVDAAALGKLEKVTPPAILNVHRWSIEEDLTLLRAVAVMGSMWAELRARLIPHRDRGHLRKRYQVLERRVKATAARDVKHEKTMTARLKTQSALARNVTMTAPHRPGISTLTMSDSLARGKGKAFALWSTSIISPHVASQPPLLPKAGPSQTRAAFAKHQSYVSAIRHSQTRAPATKSISSVAQRPKAKQSATNDQIAVSKPSVASSKLPVTTLKVLTKEKLKKQVSTSSVVGKTSPSAHSDQAAHPYYYHPAYMYQPQYHPPMPYHYYPPYYPPSYPDESSRAAYEQLAHEPNNDWSRMSHMRTMMENDTESMVASTIVTQLAKSPSKPPVAVDTPRSKRVAKTPPTAGKASRSSSRNVAATDIQRKRESPKSTKGRSPAVASPGAPLDQPSPTLKLEFSPQSYLLNDGGCASSLLCESSNMFYPQFSHNGHTMDGYDLNGVFSKQVPEALTKSEEDSNSREIVGVNHFGDSALLMENDMQAVSALNLLKTPTKSITNDRRRKSARKSAEKKSLFARVVGNADEKEKSRQKRRKVR